MVRCVVSGCPNRRVTVNRGVFNRPPKRFFNFPKDPARVQVWLAALRETHQEDAAEEHVICEDHFLPEDVSTDGVNSDAIPIMPPYLDGTLGPVSPWGAESSEEEEEEEEEESADDDPPQQNPAGGLEDKRRSASSLRQRKRSIQSTKVSRHDVSLGTLTLRFLKLLLAAPDGALDLRDVAASLQTHKRRVYDITHVLKGFDLVQKESTNWVKWTGKTPISSFLWKNPQQFQREVEQLKLVEDRLDALIRRCSQQLFDMTDDVDVSASAYVTYEDVSRLTSVPQQTVIIVKAPEETRLDIPAPQEGSIQVHLKAERRPITVLTCETGSAERTGWFSSLEESRVRTTTLHTDASGPQRAVQSV